MESALQARIRRALLAAGAYVINVRVPTVAGTPDLVVCWQGRFVALEVKQRGGGTDRGRARRQARQRELIHRAGGSAVVVRSVAEALAALEDATLYVGTD